MAIAMACGTNVDLITQTLQEDNEERRVARIAKQQLTQSQAYQSDPDHHNFNFGPSSADEESGSDEC